MYGWVWLCMAMYGYVGLCMAMYGYVGLCTLLLVTNGEPLYDAYTTYLPNSSWRTVSMLLPLTYCLNLSLIWRYSVLKTCFLFSAWKILNSSLSLGHLLVVLVNDFIRRWVVVTLTGQVSLKSYLSSKKIHLTRTTGWDLFWALQQKFVAVHFPAYIGKTTWNLSNSPAWGNKQHWQVFHFSVNVCLFKRDNQYYSGTSI